MNRLECPVGDCGAVIEAESEDEVMAQAQEHAATNHPDLDLDDETVEMIQSNIKQI